MPCVSTLSWNTFANLREGSELHVRSNRSQLFGWEAWMKLTSVAMSTPRPGRVAYPPSTSCQFSPSM